MGIRKDREMMVRSNTESLPRLSPAAEFFSVNLLILFFCVVSVAGGENWTRGAKHIPPCVALFLSCCREKNRRISYNGSQRTMGHPAACTTFRSRQRRVVAEDKDSSHQVAEPLRHAPQTPRYLVGVSQRIRPCVSIQFRPSLQERSVLCAMK